MNKLIKKGAEDSLSQQSSERDLTRNDFKRPPILVGYNYPPERAMEARDSGKLLSMRTETSLVCNLACRYCNGTSGKAHPGEISFETIKDVILQSKDLGAESVVVIGGGEPTIYPYFRDLMTFINKQLMIPVVITNTTTMDRDLAQFLFDTNSSILTKLDSLQEERQDYLTAVPGTYRKIQEGFENLIAVAFNQGESERLRLGVSFVTTSLTLDETPDIWRFCRDNNMYPNQEILVSRGRALTEIEEPPPTALQIHETKKELLKIDEQEYGYSWLVHAPLTGNGCLQHMYSVYLTTKGFIRPCADVDVELFNVRYMKIDEIIESEFFQRARHIGEYLEGKCGSCEYRSQCIGCRGIAFSTGINEGLPPMEALSREDPICGK
jgi:radical SAM protein with 4Fe4S-binding SPASM domain